MNDKRTAGKEDVAIKFVVTQEADFSPIREDERAELLTDLDFEMDSYHRDTCHLEYKLIHAEMEDDTAIRKIEIVVTLPWDDKESFTEAFQDDFIRDEVDDKPLIDIHCLIAYGFEGFDNFFYGEGDVPDTNIVWRNNVESASIDSDKVGLVEGGAVIWEQR